MGEAAQAGPLQVGDNGRCLRRRPMERPALGPLFYFPLSVAFLEGNCPCCFGFAEPNHLSPYLSPSPRRANEKRWMWATPKAWLLGGAPHLNGLRKFAADVVRFNVFQNGLDETELVRDF